LETAQRWTPSKDHSEQMLIDVWVGSAWEGETTFSGSVPRKPQHK
jgi:hypothetical protein